jgi:ABC-2 type transport system permease protein
MIDLVRAELLKARSTRSIWGLVIIGVAFCVAWAAAYVLVLMDLGDAPASAERVRRQVQDAYSMAQQGYLLALILGIVMMAGEYRHQTITWAFLVSPRRGQVIMAKLAAGGLVGLALGIAAAVVTTIVTAILLAATGKPVGTPALPLVLLGSVLSTALWAVFGASLGALIRNQVAATTVAFVWFFYIEWFLVMLAPSIGRWVPTGTAKALSGWSRDGMTGFDGQPIPGDLLPPWSGGLVFLGYALLAALAARLLTLRRDVT